MTTGFFIGILAACLTMFGFLPQIIRMHRTKSAADISSITLFQFTLGGTLWAVYGFSINDPIRIGANIVSLFTLVVALVLSFQYKGYHSVPVSTGEVG